jgi:hypothetical protein
MMSDERHGHTEIRDALAALPLIEQRQLATAGLACIWCGSVGGVTRTVGWFQDCQMVEHSDGCDCEYVESHVDRRRP